MDFSSVRAMELGLQSLSEREAAVERVVREWPSRPIKATKENLTTLLAAAGKPGVVPLEEEEHRRLKRCTTLALELISSKFLSDALSTESILFSLRLAILRWSKWSILLNSSEDKKVPDTIVSLIRKRSQERRSPASLAFMDIALRVAQEVSPDDIALRTSLLEPLVSTAEESVKLARKTPHVTQCRSAALFALAAGVTLDANNSLALNVAKDSSGFFYDHAYFDKSSDAEAEAQILIVRRLLHLPESPLSDFAQIISLGLTHRTSEAIRKNTLQVLSDVLPKIEVSRSEMLILHLIPALLKRVCNLEDQNLSCYTYTDKAILAIQAILPSSIFSSENIPVLIQFCVLAHHPFFCKRISKQNRSRAFERFLKVNLEEWNNLVDNSSNTLVKTIFTNLDYGCLSRRSLASKSAMHLILSLLSSRLAESLCSDFLTGVLIDCLETCTLAISSLSEYEISCFLVKEGEICEPQNQIADSSLSDLQTSHKKKDKKNSQKESDAEWEARIAKEVAEKRMREELSEKLHSGAIFEEQRKNREKVKLLMNPAMVVFRFLQLISCRVPKLVHEFLLVDMVPSISRAGKFNLLRSSSIETLLSLVSTMEPKLGYAKEKHLALALSLLYRNDFSFFLNDFWASEQLLESLRVIVGVSKRQMPPQSLSIVLSLVSPIVLRDVDMRASDIYAVNELNSLDIREKLFEFLRYQCDSNNIDPQKRHLFPASTVLNLLVNAISRFPNFRKICGESMVNIGEMLNLNHIDQVFGYDVLLSAFDCVRSYTLEMLENSSLLYLPLQDRNIAAIFILTCDQESSVASKATRIFNSYGLELSIGVVEELVNFSVSDKCSRFCFAISKSFFNLLSKKKDFITISWSLLFDQWVKQMDIQIEDDFGRIVDKQDNHLPRKSLLQIMASICPLLDDSLALKMFEFLITDALVDINENVWIEALNTSLCLIESHGKVHSSKFLSLLEDTLEKSSSIGNKKTFDQVNEALVILMGSTAKFLQNDSRRIIDVITSLISVLPTPSHSVQTAAARCLSPLIRLIDQEDAKISLIQKLIQQSCESTSFAQRRGFSYGVGGLLAGVKLSYVRKYGILETVIDYSASSNPISREGALFVFESLFAFIGYLFEPYAVKILPSLLRCFSDTSTLVRDAALQATRSIMETLSSHGVKLILPILLKSLQDPQWRTKVESINMLGLMSFCAPKQLSSSLPIVVPRLIEILKDPHAKVRTATEKALHDIGSVINNEEIRVLVPILLDAIYNPEKKTELALTTLIETSFVNAVDSPSLALLMPILIRGLRERSSLVKRMAAQVIGSLCSFLRSSSDILPYVDPLLVELKSLIVDPSPDVRAACSKAIGRLFMDVGEQYLITLIAWLMNMLQGETSSVEQSGGAQALSELLCALGLNYIDEYLDSILALCSSNNHRIRESFLRVIMFLPRAFEKDFYFVMERVFPLIIENLKNDRESVRSAALSAAKSIIDILGPIYPCEILDMIEPKLSDSHWRVRENVVILVGDLLHKVSGGNLSIITGDQIEFDDDEDRKPEKEASKSLFLYSNYYYY